MSKSVYIFPADFYEKLGIPSWKYTRLEQKNCEIKLMKIIVKLIQGSILHWNATKNVGSPHLCLKFSANK